ncbi:MAG TPA: DUF488 domain-containing protein [Candidatus Acidoferrum sp.]|nr:DUF488 domain-containing protein [Candidatus Acidoferrum sp.]
MGTTICTIGFAGKTAEQFFTLLKNAGVQRLIDIRENRIGQLSGFAKYPDLAFFLDRVAGITYSYEPRLAPTLEIRAAYRSTGDWAAYESMFRRLMLDRGIPERLDLADFDCTVALLCSEAEPEKCHRRIVADTLSQFLATHGYNVPVVHLISQINKSKKRKAASPDHAPKDGIAD